MRPAPPLEGPTLLRRWAMRAAGLLPLLMLSRLSQSGGELALAQWLGKVPRDIGELQWQRAGAAFERWNPGWKAPVTWTPEQVGRSVREAARLYEQRVAGAISPGAFDAGMAALVKQVDARRGAAANRAPDLASGAVQRPAASAPARPAPPPLELRATRRGLADPAVERGSQAVQALGRTIRAYGATPGPSARAALNEALAWVRSLRAREGERWTPATRADFAVYGPQAARVLAGSTPAARPAQPPPRPGGSRPQAPPVIGPTAPESRPQEHDLRQVNDQSGASRQARELERWQTAREQADALLEQERRRVKLRPPSVVELADRIDAIADPTVRRLVSAGLSLRELQWREAGAARASAVGAGAGGAEPPRPSVRDDSGGDGASAQPQASGRRYVYAQQQQPQSQGRRDAEPDPGLPQFYAALFLKRMEGALEFQGQPVHLSLKRTPAGDVSVAVDRSRLASEPRAAYDRLAERLGSPQVERLLGVLVGGDGREVGLHALAEHWRTVWPNEPLLGRTVVDLGKALSNWPDFGTLDDLAGLTELQVGTYRGIFPLTADHDEARRRISPPAQPATQPGPFFMDALPPGVPTTGALSRSPLLLQHLRDLQLAYDEAVGRGPARRERIPPDDRPWRDSGDPGLVASAAALHAFWSMLHSAAPPASGATPLRAHDPWEAAASGRPGLHEIDFSTYPQFHRAWREGLQHIMTPIDGAASELADATVTASIAARSVFADEALQGQLVRSITQRFTDRRAVAAYVRTSEFERFAQSLVLDRLEQQSRPEFQLPWMREHLRESARGWAARQAGDESTPAARLRALEALLIDPAQRNALGALVVTARIEDQRQADLLSRIESLPRQHGFEPVAGPPRDPVVPATSLREAFANVLTRHGISAAVVPGEPPAFSVDGWPTDDSRVARARNADIARLMAQVCRVLGAAGFPTRWAFTDGSR
jgi:hypothetical protein